MKRIIIFLAVIAVMALGLCACGESEDVVDIKPVPESQETAKTTQETTAESDRTKTATYESIYEEYNSKMKDASEKYVAELKKEVGSKSKDELYDLTKKKTDALNKIRKEGSSAMTDLTLASTDDDQKEYEKWYGKLSEAYTEYSRNITTVYTDSL